MLLALFLLVLPAIAAPFSASLVQGELEQGRQNTLLVEVSYQPDNGSGLDGVLAGLRKTDLDRGDRWADKSGQYALFLVGELSSGDDRLTIISAPQPFGTIRPMNSSRAGFDVRVEEGAGVGLYPLQLHLQGKRLAKVTTEGGEPQVYLSYENISQIISLEASVVLGPRIEAEGSSSARPGGQMEVVMVNRGDRVASGVTASIDTQPQFRRTSADLGDIDPGRSERFQFTAPKVAGDYPLAIRVSYIFGESERSQDLAVIAQVREGDSWEYLVPLAVAAASFLVILGGARMLSRGRGFRRRRW
ncbi:MAG: hypothetical protein A4E47_01290 [Methanosaeta sp. PtaU1.Bin028]|nr:MAG: hypothetical protein A4E47_01290 [Methanosaeta sp. PtaU1.Bin028]